MGLGLGLRLSLFFFLLQLHLLLSLPDQTSMLSAGIHQQTFVRETTAVPKELSLWVKIQRKHEMKAVAKHGGAAGGHGGGRGGIPSNGGGENSGGGQGAAVIPVYAAAAAANHNRYHHSHGSNSGHVNCIGSICLILTLLTSFFFVFCI